MNTRAAWLLMAIGFAMLAMLGVAAPAQAEGQGGLICVPESDCAGVVEEAPGRFRVVVCDRTNDGRDLSVQVRFTNGVTQVFPDRTGGDRACSEYRVFADVDAYRVCNGLSCGPWREPIRR